MASERAILFVPHDIVGKDCRVEAIPRATVNGEEHLLHHRADFCRVPPASLPGKRILTRSQALAAHDPAVALPQGWMATVLNLIMNGVTVFMVVDEEEVFESANKQTKGFLFSPPSGILSPVLPPLNHSFPPTGIFHLRYEWEFSYSGQCPIIRIKDIACSL
ncbi:MAG: hypothetical protein AB7S66_10185 [Sphaerochaeta sp.]|jgi:hypothetical protein|uniref:hypothetical protein n=1 Tax=Sphaerochaeta sp. TaxID=1972642 RepID=UPI003D131678